MASIRLENAARLYLESRLVGNAREAAEKYTGSVYKQHTAGVLDGIEGFVEYYTKFASKYKQRDIQIIRAIDGKDYVFLHCFQNLDNGKVRQVTADFFAFDASGRVIEHWDVIGPYHDNTPSEHTSLDGKTKIEDQHLTEDNKFVVLDMIENVLQENGDKSKIYSYISDEEFTQHNAELADGIENFRPLVMSKQHGIHYERVVLAAAQGNFVAALSEVNSSGKLYAQVDIFRLRNHKIVEHWDVAEEVHRYDVNSGKF